jgi:hypothetical protein
MVEKGVVEWSFGVLKDHVVAAAREPADKDRMLCDFSLEYVTALVMVSVRLAGTAAGPAQPQLQ